MVSYHFCKQRLFFHLWISQFIGAAYNQCYVIGDLNKDEAKIFWAEKVQEMERQLINQNRVVHSWPDFEIIYSVCGGNMFLIGKALDYWVTESNIKRAVNWENFPFYTQELSKLISCRVCTNARLASPSQSGPVVLCLG